MLQIIKILGYVLFAHSKKKTHTHTNMDTRTHAQLECNSQYVQIAPAKKAADLITIIKVSRELKLY